MPACEAAWALDHQNIVGYEHFEVDTGRAGRRGRPFEDGSDALANGSVRPALFPGTKQPSACGQLEGRLGTQNDRGHSARPFIFPRDPIAPPPPDPGGPRCPLRLGLLSQFKNFGGLSGRCITFTALVSLSNSAFLWWEKTVVSPLAQTTYSVVKIVNERGREKGVYGERREGKLQTEREKEMKDRKKERKIKVCWAGQWVGHCVWVLL